MNQIDEEAYLNIRWPACRRYLVRLIKAEHEFLFLDQASDRQINDEEWEVFAGAVYRHINKALRSNRDGKPNTYARISAAALVFQRADILREAYDKNRSVMCSENGGAQHVLVERAVIRMRSAQLPGTEHRRRVWSKTDQISRSLVAARGHPEKFNRCQKPHFAELSRHISEHFADNKLLSHNPEYLEELFVEFCSDCRQSLSATTADGTNVIELVPDEASRTPEEEAILKSQLPGQRRLKAALRDCIRGLKSEYQDVIQHAYSLSGVFEVVGREDLGALSAKQFCSNRNIGRTTYYDRIKKGKAALKDCIRGAFDSDSNVVEFLQ